MQQIKKQVETFIPNKRSSLLSFFRRFDAFQDRIIKKWEFDLIFPGQHFSVFNQIHEQNKKQSRLKDQEISLEFLITELQLITNYLRQELPKESEYLHIHISPQIENIIIKLSQDREIQYDAAQAFDHLFPKQTDVDFHYLDRVCSKKVSNYQLQDMVELVGYFGLDNSQTKFNKIQFVQGLQVWVDKKRPNNSNPPNQINSAAQISQLQSQISGLYNQQMQGIQLGPQQTQQLQQLMSQLTILTNQQAQMPIAPIQQNTFMNQTQNQSWQTPTQQFPQQNFQDSLQRQTSLLTNNQFQDNFLQTNQFQTNQFQQNQFQNTQFQPLNQNQPFTNNNPLEQEKKFSAIIEKFKRELSQIHEAILQRNMSVYKWFSGQAHSKGSTITDQEFIRSLNLLSLYDVRNAIEIYAALQFNGPYSPVLVSDIEDLFKIQGRNEQRKIIPDEVIANILRAFNLDDYAIQNGLNKFRPLTLDNFLTFFGQYPDHQKYFNLHDLTALGELLYVTGHDQFDLNAFLNDLVRVKKQPGMKKKENFNGIHRENDKNDKGSYSNWNSMMPDYSKDCTESSLEAGLHPPTGFRPHEDASQIESIVKACFISGRLVKDHFQSINKNFQSLGMQDFKTGLIALGCSWSGDFMFNQIDKQFNGHPIGQVTAKDIDQYIHFSCRNNLNQLHEQLLEQVENICQQRNIALLQLFGIVSRAGSSECSFEDFRKIMYEQIGVQFTANDIGFIAKKYQISGPNIQFNKLIEDINQITRFKNQSRLNEKARDMPTFIAECIKKRLYLSNEDLTKFLTRKVQKSYIMQNEFISLIGETLQLIPQYFSVAALSDIYSQLKGAEFGQVSISEIVRFFDNKSQKSTQNMMAELTRGLKQQNVARYFEVRDDYKRTKTLLKGDFEIILRDNLHISTLDAQFLATCFKTSGYGGDVDVKSFIDECSQVSFGTNRLNASEIVKKIAEQVLLKDIKLTNQLGQYRGNNLNSIPTFEFAKEINKIIQLQPLEMEDLEQAYQSKEGIDLTDYMAFIQDIQTAIKLVQFAQPVLNLTKEQRDLIEQIKKILQTHQAETQFVKSLRLIDYNDLGYISKDQLKKSIDELIVQINKKGGKVSLNKNYIEILEKVVNRNSQENLHWQQLVNQIFGQVDGQRLLFETSITQSKQGSNQIVKLGVAENDWLGLIGKKIGAKVNAFIEKSQRISIKKASDGAPIISQNNIDQILQQIDVDISNDERIQLQKWCTNIDNKDRDGDVNAYKLLVALGLQPPQTRGAPKRILSNDELKACQDFISLLRRELRARNPPQTPESIVQKYRGSSEQTMSPASFKSTLLAEFGNTSLRPKIESNQTLTLMIHYLVREEPGRVSISKLLQAFNNPESSPPLKQDGITDLLDATVKLNQQLKNTKAPLSIIELNSFMRKQNISLQTLLEVQSNELNGEMNVKDFENKLRNFGYTPKELPELIQSIQTREMSTQNVSLKLLNQHLRSLVATQTTQGGSAQQKFGKMNAVIKSKIQMISDHLINKNITLEQFHQDLDTNKDGSVDKQEFVDGISSIIPNSNLSKQDLGLIFDAIDLNGDHFLSVNEFSYYLQGAKLQKQQKKNMIEKEQIQELNKDLDDLFVQLDKKGNKYLMAEDIMRIMQGMNSRNITLEKANEMIKSVDLNGDGKIDKAEFKDLLRPMLIDELVNSDDQLEDMRAKFKEYDTDYSGFLKVDEFYACLLSMGVDVSRQEVINLFLEFDVNGDGQLDIDEFVKFFSIGDQIEFNDEGNINTYMKIKKTRKINVLDFLKIFNGVPKSYTNSFFTNRWVKEKRNLPSSVFIAQIDPRTMLWKDMLPVLTDMLTQEQLKRENMPRLRPIPSLFGSQITIESAEGVPIPAQSADFDRQNIVKRVVRIGLYDSVKQDFIFNTAQVVAEWNGSNEDIWNFNNALSSSLNPILFRTTQSDDLNKQDVYLIFELALYVKQGSSTVEMTTGWAKAPLITCDRDVSKLRLEIFGGSPLNEVAISKDDILTKRSGMKAFVKLFNNNIKSTLIVSFKPLASLEVETKLHLDMLPSTCLIQKKMLYFVSGYRNYAADLLQNQTGSLKKPAGNIVMSCFPKILDNPDLLEMVAQIWHEDHFSTLNATQKKSVELMIQKMQDIVTRIYPVLFSSGFDYSKATQTESACGDQTKLALRKQLINSALRYNSQTAKIQVKDSLDTLTSYKPFNIKELEFEVWDQAEQKQSEQFSAPAGAYR